MWYLNLEQIEFKGLDQEKFYYITVTGNGKPMKLGHVYINVI